MDDVGVITAMVDEGARLEAIDDYLEGRVDLDPDARDALALYAWARRDRVPQRVRRRWRVEGGETRSIAPVGD